MFSKGIGKIVGHLIGARLRGAYVVSANLHKIGSVGKTDGGEAAIRRVVRHIDTQQTQLIDGHCALDGEIGRDNRVAESEAEFIHQFAADQVVM